MRGTIVYSHGGTYRCSFPGFPDRMLRSIEAHPLLPVVASATFYFGEILLAFSRMGTAPWCFHLATSPAERRMGT